MEYLHANVQTTEIYTRADPSEKLDALDSVTPPNLRRGRFRPPDRLLESLRPAKSDEYQAGKKPWTPLR